MKLSRLLLIFMLVVPLAACTTESIIPASTRAVIQDATQPVEAARMEPTAVPLDPVPLSTQEPITSATLEDSQAAPTATQAPASTLAPDAWKSLPVVPTTLSPETLEIYKKGLELGNNPYAFSKVGDCAGTPAWFLGDFDRGPQFYKLGDYQGLQPTIAYYAGSFSRTSLAAKEGFNASSVFALLWANRSLCNPDETPLACEYRINKPSIAFIMLGTNDVWHKDSFEPQMRQIIEFSIQNGVIPVLTTKADNIEKNGSINATIANLAAEYGVPLWNYWRAVQDLPDKGLQKDQAHLTWGANRFNDPQVMKKAWPWRNLTALQVLDFLRRSLENGESG